MNLPIGVSNTEGHASWQRNYFASNATLGILKVLKLFVHVLLYLQLRHTFDLSRF